MSKAHRLKTRKFGSSPQSQAARNRAAMATQQAKGITLPTLNFLLGHSDATLDTYELARLDELAQLRAELHEVLDRVIDTNAQAIVIRWFRGQDRNALKHAIENEESPEEWAHRMMRDKQRSPEELLPRPSLPPGAAHLAAAKRYASRNLSEGKCRVCPKPLAHNSVEFCEEHLAKSRARAQQKKALSVPGSTAYLYAGETPSTHGRQPGTLASLAMHREKKTRALLAELGIPPESAAVSLKAAVEALLRVMPDSKAKAMTPADLFRAAVVPSRTTGDKALRQLLADGKIQRIGEPRKGHSCRYFLAAKPKPAPSGILR